jgi:hypothetical protein
MTAEEYLNKHCKPEDWNNLEECLKDSILTNNVIEHMERYAALRIDDVVRMKAVSFAKWLRDNTVADGAPKLLFRPDMKRYTIEELYDFYILIAE